MIVDLASPKPALSYWEDAIDQLPKTYGPVTISGDWLDQFLEMVGEKHPIHESDAFAAHTERRLRIVPGGVIHSVTSGWAVRHGNPVAVVGLRSIAWDFVRPVYPDTPFYFSVTLAEAEEVDERLGILKTVRRVFDAEDRTHAIGRLNSLLLRRAAAPAD